MSASVFDFTREHVVLVTGGGSGIGYEIAKAFDISGATVVIAGRREDTLMAAAESISPQVRTMPFDITDIDKIDDWIDMISTTVGPIKTLVNNAGRHQKKNSLEVTDEDLDKVLLTNLRASFALSRAVAMRILEQGSGGDIQFISSMAALFGIPYVASYTAAKSSFAGLARQLAVEWGPKGIRVNTIAPGFIQTAMSSKALDSDPERKQKVLSRTPMGRLGTPDEIGSVSVFLSSPAASFINGVLLPVDGGMSIGF